MTKMNVTEKVKCVVEKVKDIVGKGENAGLPAFSPFLTMFSKGFFLKVVESQEWVVKG